MIVEPSDGTDNVYTVCTKIEDVRREQPLTYKILEHLTRFAIKMEKGGTEESSAAHSISELVAHPRKAEQFTQHQVLFLMKHHERIFMAHLGDDANYSRCHSRVERMKQQIDHKRTIEFGSE